MKSVRIIYAILVIITIITGIFVWSLAPYLYQAFNLYAGDVLYAVMMYYMVSVAMPYKKNIIKFSAALLICYTIEFSQLYQAGWINAVRHTLPGRLILGSGFLYTDLLAYLAGVAIALILDRYLISSRVR